MSSISSVGSYSNYNTMYSSSSSSSASSGVRGHHRPDPSKMADQLFSQLDTSNKGYIEKSDLQSALDQIGSSSSSSSTSSTSNSSNADALFSKLDGDGDGKVTQDEMSTGLKQLADELDSQFNQMRMQGGAGGMQGMAPPPLPENDSGFTQDELSSQLDSIGSSDSKHSSLINNIVNNFSAADTNGDGKVNMQEAQAYEKSSQSSSSSSTTNASSSQSTQSSSDLQVMKQIMELMRAYGQQDNQNQSQDSFSQISTLLSVTA